MVVGAEAFGRPVLPFASVMDYIEKRKEAWSGTQKSRSVDAYSALIADRPLSACVVVSVIIICICLLPFAIFDELIDVDTTLQSMKVRGNEISQRYHGGEAAYCNGDPCWVNRRLLGNAVTQPSRRLQEQKLTMVYASRDDGNILIEQRLKDALSLERQAAKVLGEPLHTELPKFFPTYPTANGALAGESLQSLLRTVAEEVRDTRNQGRFRWPHYDTNFSACTLESQLVGSVFRSPQDYSIFEDHLLDLETDDVYATFFWTVESFSDSRYWFTNQRNEQIGKDTLLISGALLSVLIIICIQTRSLFVAIAALLCIILATGVAWCLYRIFVSKWFGVLNAFSIFLLLGIACDDVFVVADAWRRSVESAGIEPTDYAHRVSYVKAHSFMCITVTSLTTAGAFFGNAISNIPPVRLFGVFSGFMVVADWIITLLVLPAILVLDHRCFGNCKLRSRSRRALRWADRFLVQVFVPCVFRIAPAVCIFFAVLVAVAFNVSWDLPLGAEFHIAQLFPHDHVQSRAYRAMQAMQNLNPEYGQVSIFHGVKPEDTADSNDPNSHSVGVYDLEYNWRAVEVQQFTLDLCNDLLARRGMVRRLSSCWAQILQHQLFMMNQSFPTSNQSLLDELLQDQLLKSYAFQQGVHPLGSHTFTVILLQTTTMMDADLSYLRSAHDEWEAFMQHWNAEAKRRELSSASNGFQSSVMWIFLSTVENLATSCIAASSISLGIVAISLLISLQNIVVAMLVLAHVTGICLSLVAGLVIEGRSLGVLESVALTLLVGLSIDYLVHVAKAYLDEPENLGRERRTLNACSHLGGSVVAGSLTSIASAIFLCLATIRWFVTFGRFIISIISLALVFTMFSLVSCLYLFGPQDGFGNCRCRRRRCSLSQQTPHESPERPMREANSLTDSLEVSAASQYARLGVGIAACLIMLGASCVRLALSLRSHDEGPTACPELAELEFTFDQQTIPQDTDYYRCRGYDFLSSCSYWVTEFEPIITSGLETVVQNMMLFSTQDTVSSCPYTCFDKPDATGVDAAWVSGGDSVKWPQGMAYNIGGKKQALRLHYYSRDQNAGQIDVRSGLKLKLTSTPPSVAITNIMIGLHPAGRLSIPGNMEHVLRFAECSPRLRGNVTILAYIAHAHELGVSVITEVRRHPPSSSESGLSGFGSHVVGDVGSDPSYDFKSQRMNMFPSGQQRHLSPGDSVRVICAYNSTMRDEQTLSGWGMKDEMCMTTIYAYPSENVESTSCFTDFSYSL